jgi:DNA-binding CsgD family transcriptional regulator
MADLRAVLSAAGELPEHFSAGRGVRPLLEVVGRLVPCDSVSWARMDLEASEQSNRSVEFGYECTVYEDPALADVWWAHHTTHPIWGRPCPAVVSIGDLVSPREWHRTSFYQEFMRPAGLDHDLFVQLPHPPRETHVLLLSRGPGLDFSERDHLVLQLVRPHLEVAIRRATVRPHLTNREREILALVHDGYTNADIAKHLHVSPTTVRTHLANVFSRLGVHTRTGAVAATATLLECRLP